MTYLLCDDLAILNEHEISLLYAVNFLDNVLVRPSQLGMIFSLEGSHSSCFSLKKMNDDLIVLSLDVIFLNLAF